MGGPAQDYTWGLLELFFDGMCSPRFKNPYSYQRIFLPQKNDWFDCFSEIFANRDPFLRVFLLQEWLIFQYFLHFVIMEPPSKGKKKVLTSFYNISYFHFQFSTFPFTIFLLFNPFPFPCLFFPDTSQKISQSEVSGGHSAPCLLCHWPPGLVYFKLLSL